MDDSKINKWENKEFGFKAPYYSISLSYQLSLAFFKKALHFLKHKNYFECIKSLNHAISHNPSEELCYTFKGLVFGIILKDLKIGLNNVNKALRLNPESKLANVVKSRLSELQFKQDIYNFYI